MNTGMDKGAHSFLVAFEMRAERIFAVSEQQLDDSHHDDAVDPGDLLDQHGRGISSGNEAERQAKGARVGVRGRGRGQK